MRVQSVRLAFASVLMLAVLRAAPIAADEEGKWVRIDDFRVEKSFKFQRTAVWCWAACMELCLNYYGLHYSQEKIVGTNLGAVIAKPEDALQITKGLNFVAPADGGKQAVVSALIFNGSPSGEAIVNHLRGRKPIIMAYDDHKTFFGHCVVVTGVKYEIVRDRVKLTSVELRDPYPYNDEHVKAGGKIEGPNTFEPTFVWLVEATTDQ